MRSLIETWTNVLARAELVLANTNLFLVFMHSHGGCLVNSAPEGNPWLRLSSWSKPVSYECSEVRFSFAANSQNSQNGLRLCDSPPAWNRKTRTRFGQDNVARVGVRFYKARLGITLGLFFRTSRA